MPVLGLLIDRAGGRQAGTPCPRPFISSAVRLHHISHHCIHVPTQLLALCCCHVCPCHPCCHPPHVALPPRCHPHGAGAPGHPAQAGSRTGSLPPSSCGTQGSGCPVSCHTGPSKFGPLQSPQCRSQCRRVPLQQITGMVWGDACPQHLKTPCALMAGCCQPGPKGHRRAGQGSCLFHPPVPPHEGWVRVTGDCLLWLPRGGNAPVDTGSQGLPKVRGQGHRRRGHGA